MKRTGGLRRKTRHKLKKNVRTKGKISLRRFFQRFSEGDKVYLTAEPAVQKGLYHPRFHGKAGIIRSKQGSNYYVDIKDGNKPKTLLTHPVHLKKR
jgi:large subunit ribosomal protein L21e